MKNKMSLSIILFMISFLLITLLLFAYNRNLNVKIIEESLVSSAKNQLSYTRNQIHDTIREFELYSMKLASDNEIIQYQNNKEQLDYLDSLNSREAIRTRMISQLNASKTMDMLTIYWPDQEEEISTNKLTLDQKQIENVKRNGWHYINQELHYYSMFPYTIQNNPSNIEFIVDVKMKSSYLLDLLDVQGNKKDVHAFYYIPQFGLIQKEISQADMMGSFQELIKKNKPGKDISVDTVKYANDEYYVIYTYIPNIQTYLVTYIQMSSFLKSLQNVNLLFMISLAVIIVSGMVLIFTLYKWVFRQLLTLVYKFRAFARGDYSTRIDTHVNNEFGFLFSNFNSMADKVESLIQRLSSETELRQAAELKQLQSQINPHFLYNNLFYIMSMAEQSPKAVVSMTNHLAQYYRYVTKRKEDVTLENELDLAHHYLEIMSMRKNIKYKLNVPDAIKKEQILPLIIQPIIENAILHGIEGKQDASQVILTAKQLILGYQITIEDDGKGLTSLEQEALKSRIYSDKQPEGNHGIGLWNIHHRLTNYSTSKSGLEFSPSALGGLKVSFCYYEGERQL